MRKLEIKESQVLLDLRRYREEFYEKTKNLSHEAIIKLINEGAEEVIKTYNLNLPRAESGEKTNIA